MNQIKNYLSLVKFSHTIFALPFALIGFFIGVKINWAQISNDSFSLVEVFAQTFMLKKLLLVLICMVTARSAAMAFNRYLDRDIDAKNPRTAIREIPQGIISSNQALLFVLINALAFIISTYFINAICFYLSPIALFVILFYSYTKRFTYLCHLVLGVGLSLAPIGAFLAVTGFFHFLPILFSFAVLFWVSGFDVIYALQDAEFDQSQKLYSIPSFLGKSKGLIVSEVLHVIAAVCIVIAGIYGSFSFYYWIGALIFCSLLLYQHSIVSAEDLSKVNIAFMTTNGMASIVFSIFVILDIFINHG